MFVYVIYVKPIGKTQSDQFFVMPRTEKERNKKLVARDSNQLSVFLTGTDAGNPLTTDNTTLT